MARSKANRNAGETTPQTTSRPQSTNNNPPSNTGARALSFNGAAEEPRSARRQRPRRKTVADRLISRGYAVIQLNPKDAAIIRRAGTLAENKFTNGGSTSLDNVCTIRQPGGTKDLLDVHHSALHDAAAVLQSNAMRALGRLAEHLELPASSFDGLVAASPEYDNGDASFLSAMRYTATDAPGTSSSGASVGGEEHVDRGLLTLIAGQSDGGQSLEVYDRITHEWVVPTLQDTHERNDTSGSITLVILVGATLHRACAGLVPANGAPNGEQPPEIGALRHRVARPPPGTVRQSLVYRLRARPEATFEETAARLGAQKGAVERFVSGSETVGAFLASQNFTSVNKSVEPPDVTDSDGSGPPKLEALAESWLDAVSEACVREGLLTEHAVDLMSDAVADSKEDARCSCMLHQILSLHTLFTKIRLPTNPLPCGKAALIDALRAAAEEEDAQPAALARSRRGAQSPLRRNEGRHRPVTIRRAATADAASKHLHLWQNERGRCLHVWRQCTVCKGRLHLWRKGFVNGGEFAIDAASIVVGADAVDALLEGREPSQLRDQKGKLTALPSSSVPPEEEESEEEEEETRRRRRSNSEEEEEAAAASDDSISDSEDEDAFIDRLATQDDRLMQLLRHSFGISVDAYRLKDPLNRPNSLTSIYRGRHLCGTRRHPREALHAFLGVQRWVG